ncbi:hypothetical protein [Atopomonas sediminilitoris]|uniref:hypothetical protein n=1 Tax=Atopomonas sediminilitoris TaxID=2919919 RepID=UPI001F4E17D2|nr:hypothetical protein [Atopomonas sediminilitoris]MCJ8168938.1 hypothetical protein [Atopomonas sediminilitoris]
MLRKPSAVTHVVTFGDKPWAIYTLRAFLYLSVWFFAVSVASQAVKGCSGAARNFLNKCFKKNAKTKKNHRSQSDATVLALGGWRMRFGFLVLALKLLSI